MVTVFALRGAILSINVTLHHDWLWSGFGQSYGEFPTRDWELTSLEAARIGLVLLKPDNLGLSHLVGICSCTTSEEISNAELSTQGEGR